MKERSAKKLVILNRKAEKCMSRKKAVKLLKKWDKLEKPILIENDSHYPP